jgi:hypothetical protein
VQWTASCVINVQFIRFEVNTSVHKYSFHQTGEPIVLAIHLVSHSRVPYGLVHSGDCFVIRRCCCYYCFSSQWRN